VNGPLEQSPSPFIIIINQHESGCSFCSHKDDDNAAALAQTLADGNQSINQSIKLLFHAARPIKRAHTKEERHTYTDTNYKLLTYY